MINIILIFTYAIRQCKIIIEILRYTYAVGQRKLSIEMKFLYKNSIITAPFTEKKTLMLFRSNKRSAHHTRVIPCRGNVDIDGVSCITLTGAVGQSKTRIGCNLTYATAWLSLTQSSGRRC